MYVEPAISRFLQRKATALRIPINATFELSPQCNFHCPMCYVHLSDAELKATGRRLLTADEWLTIAREAREEGMLYLLLTGGEPFLRPDFREIYEQLAQMGLILSINSNASLIDEKTVDWLSRHSPSRINITLYGASNEAYRRQCGCADGFDRVTTAIHLLREANIPVKLNGSLTPLNAQELPELVRFSEENELIFEVATYMFPPLRRGEEFIGQNRRFTPQEAARWRLETYRLQHSTEEYTTYLQQLVNGLSPMPLSEECDVEEPNGTVQCRAGRASFWVTWDGNMSPCGMLTRPLVYPLADGFAAAWNQLTEQTEAIRLSSRCVSCSNRQICRACAAMELCETGEFGNTPTFLCRLTDSLREQAAQELSEQTLQLTKRRPDLL